MHARMYACSYIKIYRFHRNVYINRHPLINLYADIFTCMSIAAYAPRSGRFSAGASLGWPVTYNIYIYILYVYI